MKIQKLSLEERKTTFDEVELSFTKEQAIEEAKRCLDCKNPLCVQGCPAKVNIPDFIRAIKNEDFDNALEIIRENNFFPSICGRICQHEMQCEGNCVLKNTAEGSINIGALERFVGDNAEQKFEQKLNGKVAAIIGSGPSGLTAAAILALNGINVKVFEISNSFGGVIKYGVPEFRLPKKIVSKELKLLHDLGIDFEPNSKIAEETIEELSEKFDVVFMGTGVGSTRKLNVPGKELKGIISAMKFLVNLNQNDVSLVSKDENVVVVGAGYVGIDAARSAIRLGAKVKCITVASRENAEKSVSPKDYLEAEEEGVEFLFNYSIDSFEPKDEINVGTVHYTNGKKDFIEADKVILAIGQEHDCEELKKPLRKEDGCVEVNKKHQTKIKNVFAAGDCVHGPKTVIEAIANGREAAKEMLQYLKKIEEEKQIKEQKDIVEKDVLKNKGDNIE
jgi:glutamate synthase (NADPH) small chain